MAKRNPYLKKAGALDEFTVEQMHELVRCATDPLYFVDTYCKIIHPVEGVVSFKLHGYQRNLIHNYHTAANTIVLSPRQTGKCCHELTLINTIEHPSNFIKKGILKLINRNLYDNLYSS